MTTHFSLPQAGQHASGLTIVHDWPRQRSRRWSHSGRGLWLPATLSMMIFRGQGAGQAHRRLHHHRAQDNEEGTAVGSDQLSNQSQHTRNLAYSSLKPLSIDGKIGTRNAPFIRRCVSRSQFAPDLLNRRPVGVRIEFLNRGCDFSCRDQIALVNNAIHARHERHDAGFAVLDGSRQDRESAGHLAVHDVASAPPGASSPWAVRMRSS